MAYTPLQPNQQPVLGTSGDAVSALQTQINTQNAGNPNFIPLKVDGLYGPKTQAAANPPVIVSGKPAMQEYASTTGFINKFAETDPYIQAFQAMQAKMGVMNQQAEKNTIASATAETMRKKQAEETGQRQYMAGLETAGIQSGASRYLPEYQAGIIEDARRSYVERYAQIDQAEKLAIAKAQQARMEGDVTVMRDQLDLIKTLRKEKADALENAQKMEWEKTKFDRQMALQWAQEGRLSKTSGEDGLEYTESELKKLRGAGIDPTNKEMADNYLYGKVVAPSKVTKEYLIDELGYSTNDLWNIALKLGVPRKKNLSKENEVSAMFADPVMKEYIQMVITSGGDLKEILNQ